MLPISKRNLFSPRLADRILEGAPLSSVGVHEATTTRLSFFSRMTLLHVLEIVLAARVEHVLGVDDAGERLGVLSHGFDIYYPGDVAPAVTDEDPDSGSAVGDGFFRVVFRLGARASRRS
jgi:hypothetical protein